MKRKIITVLLTAVLSSLLLIGCGDAATDISNDTDSTISTESPSTPPSGNATIRCDLEDGVYTVDFDTDSGMFHVNETCDGKATLTVADGQMVVHITLASKNIVNLYLGLAADAANDSANVINPTTDSVTYSDGYTEDVYGFDVPVPYLDEEFDLALIGKKDTWYDHKVMVSNPQPQ